MHKLRVALIAAIMSLMAVPSFAQDNNWISDQDPNQIQQDEIDKQIEALLELYNALAGAGFVNTAELHRIGGIDVRLSFLGSPVPEQFRDIIPTVKDPLEGVEFTSFGVLHGNLGLLPRLEVYGRFFTLPVQGEPKGGNVTLIGGGLKFGILEDKPGSPALIIMGGYQGLLVPDEFDFGSVGTLSLKAYISKSLPVVTLYAGGGADRTDLSLTVPGLPPQIDEGYKLISPQGTAGVTFKFIPFVKLNAEANFSTFWSFAAGAALSVR
jgi:hypothetical protein